LEFVVRARGVATGSERSAAGAVEDDRNGGGVDVEQPYARLTQTVGGVYPTPAVDRGEKLVVDRHI
jgi:hypothetical protein